MALVPLQNPLEILAILPNVMNWRGTWDVTEQYFKNDVVVSPVNQASYILNGQNSSFGGADPTLNPDWIELSLPTTGVASVSAGAGMALNPLGTSTNPILDNAGVRTLTQGAGIIVDNTDPRNPSVENAGVITVRQGSGINIDNSNPQSPLIENDGVIFVDSIGAGINVDNTDPKNPIVSNTGIVAVSAGTGISVSTTTGNATVSCTLAQPLLAKLRVDVAQGSIANNPFLPTGPITDITAAVEFVPDFFDAFYTILQDPTKGGGFLMDLTGFTFSIYTPSPSLTNASIAIGLGGEKAGVSPVTQFTFPIVSTNNGIQNLARTANTPLLGPYNYIANGGQAFLDLATYRTASVGTIGIATLPRFISFTNQTGQVFFFSSFPSVVFMTYYPNGIQ